MRIAPLDLSLKTEKQELRHVYPKFIILTPENSSGKLKVFIEVLRVDQKDEVKRVCPRNSGYFTPP